MDVTEETTDPRPWGKNWPREFERYQRTVEPSRTNFGGGDAPAPKEKAETLPWLTRMFAGYAFALDYRDRRGHAYMLLDQEKTRRVTERPQPGACLHCHASIIPTYRRLGTGDTDWDKVRSGFATVSAMTYQQAHAEVVKTGSLNPVPQGNTQGHQRRRGRAPGELRRLPRSEDDGSCASRGRASSSASRRWRPRPSRPRTCQHRTLATGRPRAAYDPNRDATRQEMRSYVCGQCHVEYYCGPKTTLFFPWNNGLKVEEIESLLRRLQVPRRPSLLRLAARRDGRGAAQGAAPGVRAVEPGHARAQRRGVRRLPHALRARRAR